MEQVLTVWAPAIGHSDYISILIDAYIGVVLPHVKLHNISISHPILEVKAKYIITGASILTHVEHIYTDT